MEKTDMEKAEIVAKKLILAKQRVEEALKEYAVNQALLKDKIEWKDLVDFLKIWHEECSNQIETMENQDKLFQLSLLISNLDIQLDMLRVKPEWQKTVKEVPLPPEFNAVLETVAAISQ